MWLCKRDLSKECGGKYRDCTDCVLDKIRSEIQKLRNCSCNCPDGIIDDVEEILDKYKAKIETQESEDTE